MCWHIYKEKLKVVLLFYLPTLWLWILYNGSFTNSECTFFWKGKQVYTRLFGLRPSGQGGHSIHLPKYKWEENVFLFFLIIYLLTVIQWVTKACRCTKQGKQPSTRFFLNNIAFLTTGGHKIRLYYDGRVENNIMKKKNECKVTPFHVIIQWNYLFY